MSPKINPTLSIIIPAFNEIKRIGKTLASIRAYVRDKRLACEVIVVDDGSTDGTSDFVEGLIADMPYLRVLRLPKNDGKGLRCESRYLRSQWGSSGCSWTQIVRLIYGSSTNWSHT